MGEVYKARDTRLDRIVAIKVLPAHLADKPELLAGLEDPAVALSPDGRSGSRTGVSPVTLDEPF